MQLANAQSFTPPMPTEPPRPVEAPADGAIPAVPAPPTPGVPPVEMGGGGGGGGGTGLPPGVVPPVAPTPGLAPEPGFEVEPPLGRLGSIVTVASGSSIEVRPPQPPSTTNSDAPNPLSKPKRKPPMPHTIADYLRRARRNQGQVPWFGSACQISRKISATAS